MKLMNTKTGQCVCFSWARWDSCCHFCCPFLEPSHPRKPFPTWWGTAPVWCMPHWASETSVTMDPDGLDLDPGFFFFWKMLGYQVGPPSSNTWSEISHINGLVEGKHGVISPYKIGAPYSFYNWLFGPTYSTRLPGDASRDLFILRVSYPHILSGVKLWRRFCPNEKWPSTKFADWRESPSKNKCCFLGNWGDVGKKKPTGKPYIAVDGFFLI